MIQRVDPGPVMFKVPSSRPESCLVVVEIKLVFVRDVHRRQWRYIHLSGPYFAPDIQPSTFPMRTTRHRSRYAVSSDSLPMLLATCTGSGFDITHSTFLNISLKVQRSPVALQLFGEQSKSSGNSIISMGSASGNSSFTSQ